MLELFPLRYSIKLDGSLCLCSLRKTLQTFPCEVEIPTRLHMSTLDFDLGSGASLLLCCLTALAFINQDAGTQISGQTLGFKCPCVPFLPVVCILINTYLLINLGLVSSHLLIMITDVENLIVAPISKASARQRAGRAGRVRPGKCLLDNLRYDVN
ncbi:hypothetical protein POM88_020710 [Heracleum sosnowskyi]|uniref:Cationic amino acid transporter C-terminal domain-containing protein n=1 Tax=Heracleum sosnowskyi TaxID=360622 RepID=A0AAD8IFK9_9APIA|nr:hypothetical protein POM88_020710 [Heracleum sosnowskyi]